MGTHRFDQRLSVGQTFCLGLGALLLVDGIDGYLTTSDREHPFRISAGAILLALAWLNNFRVMMTREDPQDPVPPATEMDAGDHIVVWATVILAVGLVAGAATDDWEATAVGVGIGAALAVLLRATFLRSRELEKWVLPVIALVGQVRPFFLGIGSWALLRGLAAIPDDGAITEQVVTAGTGIGLLLLAFLEQAVLTRRRDRPTPPPGPVTVPPECCERVIAAIDAVRLAVTGSDAPAPPAALRPTRTARPMWFTITSSVALLGLGGYLVWIGRDGESTLLGLAAFVLVLGVMGERLANLTFKAGVIEASVGTAPDEPDGAVPGDGGAPDDTRDPAPTLTRLDLGDTAETFLLLTEGQPNRQLLQEALEGRRVPTMSRSQVRDHLARERPKKRAPAPTLTIKGPADDVRAVLAQVLDQRT